MYSDISLRTAMHQDPILHSLQATVAALRSLNALEVAGRTMMTFMRGHMSEIGQKMSVVEYFHEFYDDVAKEFVQLDDEDFAIHHCARTLFDHWKEETDLLRASSLGASLERIGASLPLITTPTRSGRSPVASSWYEEVVNHLRSGSVWPQRDSRNPIMDAEECVLHNRPDLIWPQFLVWCGETWGRQCVVVWELVREAIAMRRMIEEQLDEQSVHRLVEQDENAYRTAARDLTKLYDEWHSFHSGTIDVHDPMYDKNLAPLMEWLGSFAPDLTSWLIKEPTKDEMYLEVACAVADLRGESLNIEMPEFNYWRRTPWTPECIRVGAPGMPPFKPFQVDS